MNNAKNLNQGVVEALMNIKGQTTIYYTSVQKNINSIVNFSKGAEKLTAYKKNELIGKSDSILFYSEDLEKLKELEKTMFITREGFQTKVRMQPKTGMPIPVEISIEPMLNDSRDIIGTFNIANDLRTTIEARERLRKSEEKFRTLFERSDDALLILDGDQFTDYNPAVLKMLGADKNQMKAIPPWKLSPEYQPDGRASEEKAMEMINMAWENGSHRFEWVHKKMNGDNFPVEVILTPVSYGDKSVLYTVWRDISQRKKLMTDLIIAKEKAEESDELKSAFIANMSHEIRTPMNSILGFSELLSDNLLSDSERIKFTGIIQSSSNQLLSIISDIIDISKIEAGQMILEQQKMTLDSVFRELHEQYTFTINQRKTKNLTIKREGLSQCCHTTVMVDPNKFRQILTNLIDNAMKFTSHGEISFGCTHGKTGFVKIFVKDTGVGIPKDKEDLIFDRFFQNKNHQQVVGGTGLGLSICRSLVDMMGGEIGVNSIENVGSEFWFTIPINSME